jgi:hypothetical protein
MSKYTANPLAFANLDMNKLMFKHGLFTYVDRLYSAAYLRMKMQRRDGVQLIQRINDINRVISSVWYLKDADAYIMLREFNCRGNLDCYANHGNVSISATTHDGLAKAIGLYQSHEEDDLDDFLIDDADRHEF